MRLATCHLLDSGVVALDHGDVLRLTIAEAVERCPLTRSEVASRAGLDQSRLSRLLNGDRGSRFYADEVMAIERALDLSPGEFFARAAGEAAKDAKYRKASTVEDAVRADPALSSPDRAALLRSYRAMTT